VRQLAAAALVLAIGFLIARAPVIRPSLGGALLASAREVAVYRLGAAPVRFAVPAGKRTLRVLVNLDLGPSVPEEGVPFEVRVEIPEDRFSATFPLVAVPALDATGGPAAFYLGEGSKPARTRDVAVERTSDGPATVLVSLPSPPGAGASVRLLTAEARPPLARDVLLSRLGPLGRARLATSVGPLDWDQLDEGVREGLLAQRWVRAVAAPGTDSSRLYLLGTPAPTRRGPRPRGEAVGEGRVAALSFRGPGTIHLLALEGPLHGEAVKLDADGTSSTWPLALGEGERASLPIGAGLATVRVSAKDAGRVQAVATAGLALDPARTRALPGGEAEVEPAWSVESASLAAPEPAPPLVFDLAGRGGEALRISARALLGPDAGVTALRLRWRLLDRQGAALARGQLEAAVRPAPEDRIDADDLRVPAQPAYAYLWPPASAERLEIWTDRPAAVGLSSPGFAPDLLVGPKPGLAASLVERFQPEDRPAWFRVRPVDEASLWAAGRIVTLRSARRIEPLPEPPKPPVEAESLEPGGGAPRILLVAPATPGPDGNMPEVGPLARGNWWPVAAGVETLLDLAVPAGSAADARVQLSLLYAGEASLAGREARVSVDGRAPVRLPMVSQRGQVTLPLLPAGRHRLKVEVGAPARLFLDVPVAGSQLHRAYAAYELGPGGPLILRLAKGVAARSLGVTLYFDGPPSPRARLSARIDGGVRAVRAGTSSLGWTRLERQAPVQAAAGEGIFYLNRSGGTVWTAAPIFVPLHDDLRPGDHEIAVAVLDAGTRTFARFFAYGAAGPAEHVSHFNEIHTETPP
jgi:hypothetical protein